MNEDNTILEVNGLHIIFNGMQPFTAVNNLSFSIAKGKTLAIVGESGSGKSLTALALMGLQPKSAILTGQLHLHTFDQSTIDLSHLGNNKQNRSPRGQHISMVFQEPMSALNPVMKVGKQLQEAISTHQPLSNTDAKKRAIDWLGKVQLPEPAKIYDRYPHQLSGGQKQRIMIAIAMCNHPQLLIADEPTTALDVTVQQEIMHLMHFLQQEHQSAMIFITHDLSLAATIADDVLVMYKGEAMEYGPAQQILSNPQHPYTQALLACRPSPQHKGKVLPVVADFLRSTTPDYEDVQVNATQNAIIPLSHLTPPSPLESAGVRPSEQLLVVKELKVWFADQTNLLGKTTNYFKAVDDVSFIINKGETLGLVGESGCGKSTLSKALIGLLPVKSGTILFNNTDLANIPLRKWNEVRTSIQMIFQDPYSSLNPRMTIGDTIKEPLAIHNIVAKKELDKEVLRLLDIVQLPATAINKYPHEFSGGQRQRIGIARALSVKPQLLICDESVSALDVSIQAQILNLLKQLQRDFALTYLFISHDLSVVHYISDRVMVMQAGKIVETGDAVQVLKHPTNDYTKRLIAAMP